MKRVLLMFALGACASSHPAPARKPTTTTSPEKKDGAMEQRGGAMKSRVGLDDPMVCPSSVEGAAQAFNDATDAEKSGNLERAITLYQQALQLDPKYCDAMDNLGVIYRNQGRVDDAIALYKASLALAPDDRTAHQNLAVALRAKGQDQDALNEYQWMMTHDPDDPEGWFGAGQVYAGANRMDDAIPLFEQAEQLYLKSGSPYVDDARYTLGLIYAQKGDAKKTRDYLEEIYPRYGRDANVNLYLGLAYETDPIKDKAKAKEYLARAKELGANVPDDAWNAAQ
jgi:tetratricopeptide (TPR) repeat protein